MVHRRSLTMETSVDVGIQHYRAASLRGGKDKNYTEAVNELLKEILEQKRFIEKEATDELPHG
jgi:hypothetical protein